MLSNANDVVAMITSENIDPNIVERIGAAWVAEFKRAHGHPPHKYEIVELGIDEDSGSLYAAVDAWILDDRDVLDASYVAFLNVSGTKVTWMRGVQGRLSREHRGALDLFSRGLPIEQLETL